MKSIYSDLLVINRKESFTIYREEFPSDFIRDILVDMLISFQGIF